MTYSKIHQKFSKYLKQPDALTDPEKYLGPNYQDVLNFWIYLDTLSDQEKEELWQRFYWDLDGLTRLSARNASIDAATEVVGEEFRCEAWWAALSVTGCGVFCDATLELIGDIEDKVAYDLIMSHKKSCCHQDLDESASRSYNSLIQPPFTMTQFKLDTISALERFSPINIMISDLKTGQEGWTTIGPNGNTAIYYKTKNNYSPDLEWFIGDTLLTPKSGITSTGEYPTLVKKLPDGYLKVIISTDNRDRQKLREYFDQNSNSLDFSVFKNLLDVSEVIVDE
jgi:hypothetical protein